MYDSHHDISRAIVFALERHKDQLYAGLPVAYHLSRVAYCLGDFGYLDYVNQATGWLHDVVEDTATQIEEIHEKFGHEVGDLVWACSGFGVNRIARNLDIERKIRAIPAAAIPKTADRIANLEQTIKDNDYKKALMYANERPQFVPVVANLIPAAMLARMEGCYDALVEIINPLPGRVKTG